MMLMRLPVITEPLMALMTSQSNTRIIDAIRTSNNAEASPVWMIVAEMLGRQKSP